jgi:hypothetical protein
VLAGVTVTEPEVLFVPLQAPEAVQESASVELQVSVLVAPALIDVDEALKLTVGAGVLLELELELDAPEPPLTPVPVLLRLPPSPPPHALNANRPKNKTGRRFIESLLQENIKQKRGQWLKAGTTSAACAFAPAAMIG